MAETTGRRHYGGVAKTFHWLSFLLIAGLFGVGWYMTDLPLSPATFEIYALHKSFGLTVMALTALRVLWRIYNPPPPLPAGLPRIEVIGAKAAHHLTYFLLFAIPLAGLLQSGAADFPVQFFGAFNVPTFLSKNPEWAEIFEETHELLGQVLLVVLVVHVAAALRHHFLLRDDVLVSMLPGKAKTTEGTE